jgi:antitoxin component YwqK of YwqJK toxin-antitoxin module
MTNIKFLLALVLLTATLHKSFSQTSSLPTNGLILHLDAFDEKSNAKKNWIDLSGFNNSGKLENKPLEVFKNQAIQSLYFNGVSDFVSIPNSPSLNPSTGITIISWFKLNGLYTNQNIISKGYNLLELPYVQYSLKMSDDSPFNKPQFNLSINGKLTALNSSIELSPDIWYQVACTYNGNTMKIFVNNVQDKKVIQKSGSIDSYASTLEIGRWPTGKSQNLSGFVSKIYVYNRSLSVSELESIWDSTKSLYGYLKGSSKIQLPDGRVYEGEYTYYKPADKTESTMIVRNGHGVTYHLNSDIISSKGFYRDNMLQGNGIIYNKEGVIYYEGEFKDDLPNGLGKFYNEFGRLAFEGELRNGNPNGFGKIYGKETKSLYYEGEFVNGNYNGTGKIYYPNGSLQYEGQFKDGLYDGQGKLYYLENGKLEYDGQFKNSKFNGIGKHYYSNGTLQFTGTFINDLREGYGKKFKENGEPYGEGYYKNDRLHGKGKLWYDNGSLMYEGDLFEGRMEGYGKQFYKTNGNLQYEGEYINNAANGRGKAYDESGNLLFEGEWKDGKNILPNQASSEDFFSEFRPQNSNTNTSSSRNTETRSENSSSTKPSSSIFDEIYNRLTPSEKSYFKQVLKMNIDPNKKLGAVCSKAIAKCNWCGKQFSYNKFYSSRIKTVQDTQDPLVSAYGNAMVGLALAFIGKEKAITQWANDLKQDLRLIKSGSVYFCSGDAPKFCSKQCEFLYRR